MQERVPSGTAADEQAREESLGIQEDKEADTGTSTLELTDAQILWERFLISSEDGRGACGTVYYGKAPDTVKEF